MMKKIFSLLLVVSMLFAMMISANAAYTMGFSTTTPTVKVGETFDVALDIGLTDGTTFSGGSVTINYDKTYATLTAINTGTLTAAAGTPAAVDRGFANWTINPAAAANGTYLVATFEAIAPTDAFVVNASTVSYTFRNPTARVNDASKVASATVKIETDAPAEPTAPATAKEENLRETAAGYDNVWVGKYSATAAADTKITSVGVKFAEDKKFSKAVESEGTVTFSIALIGVPEGTDLFGEVVTTAEWK